MYDARACCTADASGPPGVGCDLLGVNERSVSGLPGFVQLVVQGNFVGVVCEREEQAVQAQQALELTWSEGTGVAR